MKNYWQARKVLEVRLETLQAVRVIPDNSEEEKKTFNITEKKFRGASQ